MPSCEPEGSVDSTSGDLRRLASQVAELRVSLANREAALSALHRRLWQLEATAPPEDGDDTTRLDMAQPDCAEQVAALQRDNAALREEIERIMNTKTFRALAPMRRAYSKLRALR